jgi:hypothetical protein
MHHLGVLYLLGIVHIEVGLPRPNEGWNIEWITLTPFGTALLSLLYTDLIDQLYNMMPYAQLDEQSEEAEVSLQRIFQPYFPAWKNTFVLPEPDFVDGVHIFKVILLKAWRRIAIDARETLDALAQAILHSVNFDNDHLYEFRCYNRIGIQERISHPYTQESPYTSQVYVGDLGLAIGQHITFLFDFGDDWEFDLVLEAIEPDLHLQGAEIRAEHGEAPMQYPYAEDDDWEIFLIVDDKVDFDEENDESE